MIKRIATGDGGEPVVLAELNEHEKEALTRILRLAGEHLDEIQFPKVGKRRMVAEMMLDAMYYVFSIPKPGEKR